MTVTIDPRLPQELADLLDAHEVPHEEGALLWEIEKRGYYVNLGGPSDGGDVSHRWKVAVFSTSDDGMTIRYGQTARLALARAFQWIVSREGE